jgi:hypothetical protein
MIGFGEVLTFLAFVGLICGGVVFGSYHGHTWAGIATGVVAWLALMAGFLAWTTISDHLERERYPYHRREPWYAAPLIWTSFLLLAAVATLLYRWLNAFPPVKD